jgi:DNA repair protein RadC
METMATQIREMPPSERPRERLLRCGSDALSSAELIAIVLGSGTEGDNALDLAERLLANLGGVRSLAGATVLELSAVRGIGPAKAAQLQAAAELGRRCMVSQPADRPRIRGPRDVWELLSHDLRDEVREHFFAILLDTRNGVLRRHVVSVGDLNSAIVHPREVFSPAIRHGAAALVVAHNHPSGDPTPSPEDVQVTKRLLDAGRLLGIELLDHVVLTESGWVSLKERGMF